jgi:hypothetical protein
MAQEVPFVILHGDRFIRAFAVATRLTVGSGSDCQLSIEDPGIEERWGALFQRDGNVYAQREGGAAQKLEPGDAVTVGPFTLVRSGPRTEIHALTESAEPGAKLGFQKDPFNLVVLLGGTESRRGGLSTRGARVNVEELQRPVGLTRGGFAERQGFRKGGGDGNRYDAQPNMSAAAERVVGTASRAIQRLSGDPAAAEQVGKELLADILRLSFPEIVAVLRRLATGQQDNLLEAFYARVLAASPVLSFRWAAIIAERFAAAARGHGADASLPSLRVGFEELVSREATEGFRKARELGGKLVAGGPW